MEQILTSESVNIGHPDKTCDYIADCFLDETLEQDPQSQMAVECAIKNNHLFIYGEATTNAKINYAKIARKALKEIGYKNRFKIKKVISSQSPDIADAVKKSKLCANDQGVVFGYATNETSSYLPLTIEIAHYIMKVYDDFRKTNLNFYPDAKSQVWVKYVDGVPSIVTDILISVSHSEDISLDEIKNIIENNVLSKVFQKYAKFIDKNTKILINPSGKFTIWGSFGDSGCVGRKIVVDGYGSIAHVGGGCFSSKNATKVDRSGAYYARFVAKNLVANGLCDRCEISASYAIGIENAIAINIDCFGTNKVSMSEIYEKVHKNFDFSVDNIIKELDLTKPIFKQTSCFGHFGNLNFSWEKIKDIK